MGESLRHHYYFFYIYIDLGISVDDGYSCHHQQQKYNNTTMFLHSKLFI